MSTNNHVRILLVRHGESEGNVDFMKYIEKGDSKVALTQTGWQQVVRTGEFLKDFYRKKGVTTWPTIFLSPWNRTRQSLAGIVHGMDGHFSGKPKLYEDWRLSEKFFGAASYFEAPHEDMDPAVIKTLSLLSKLVYQNDPLSASNMFGESTKQIRANVKSLMDGSLDRDIHQKGRREFLFVIHGAVIQAFIMNYMHIRYEDKNKIGNAANFEGNPNNGDVIEISGTKGNWTAKKLWDGTAGKKMNRNVVAGLKPFSYDDLPPVPNFLKAVP